MVETHEHRAEPQPFDEAVAAIRACGLRPEVVVTEITAPAGLAPHSFALAADVAATRFSHDSELGTGRFVLLYDPDEPEPWGGPFRVVCYAQAPLDLEIATDPFLADVAWSWLVDSLDSRSANYRLASGTITKELSQGYGELAAQGSRARVEVRASWSPAGGGLETQLEAWVELLCMLAGLPPIQDGVGAATARRNDSD